MTRPELLNAMRNQACRFGGHKLLTANEGIGILVELAELLAEYADDPEIELACAAITRRFDA